MNNLHVLLPDQGSERRRLWIMTGLFGLFTAENFLLTASAASDASTQALSSDHFILALFSLTLSTLARQDALLRLMGGLEGKIQALRSGLINKLLSIPLNRYEGIGAMHIHHSLRQGTRVLSELNGVLSKLFILGVRGLAMLLALYWISITSFSVVLTLLLSIAAMLLWGYRRGLHPALSGVEVEQRRLTRGIEDLIYGFAELKLNPERGGRFRQAAILARLQSLTRAHKVESRWQALHYVSAEGAVLLLGGSLLFLLPSFDTQIGVVAVTGTIVALCMPTTLLRDIPQLMNAGDALLRLQAIERELDAVIDRRPSAPPEASVDHHFATLEVRQMLFRYPHGEKVGSFGLGPIDLSFEAGRVYFIVGGNGSGKSTLLKLLTGLYPWNRGELLLDGRPITRHEQTALVAPIFYDAYLFERLYGLPVDAQIEARALAYLRRFKIDHKVQLVGDRFTTLDLSAGQRKRLALVQALLENRPILLLDEWAADQDPEFRHYFYTELLPWLRAEGKTVIAITHDDRYFHLADRVIELEYGRIKDSQNPRA